MSDNCRLLVFERRKFGLVCAFLNQAVYLVYIVLICILMDHVVPDCAQKEKWKNTTNISCKNSTDDEV